MRMLPENPRDAGAARADASRLGSLLGRLAAVSGYGVLMLFALAPDVLHAALPAQLPTPLVATLAAAGSLGGWLLARRPLRPARQSLRKD